MSLNSSKYASGFSPQNIPGLVVWLDAADSNAVTQSAGVVSYWRDKSPNPIDVSQNTLAARPTYESNVQNGLPALRFTTSQMMQSASNFTLDRGQTWFVSFRALATGNIFFVEQGPNTNTTNGQFLYGGNNSLMYMTRGGASRFIDDPAGRGTTPFLTNVWYVCGFVTSNNNTASTDVYWSINGASRTCAISGTVTGTATNQLYINNTARVPGSNYMGEILIYNWAMPSNQVRLVERYLAYKWGVTLPTAHPFSSTPATLRAFNPLDISGCSLWLDAADYSTLTFSTGSNVSQWNDKSGNGHTATASGTATPTYSSSTQYLLFNGSTNALTLSTGALPSGNGAYSIFIVAYTNNAANAQWILVGGGEATNQALGVFFFTTNAVWHSWWVNEYAVNNSITNGVPSIINVNYTTIRTTITNGGAPTTNTPGATRNNGTGNNFIGRRISAVEFLNGGIAEIVIFSREIPTDQRQQVELYLAEKWNLRSSLSTSNTLRLYESLSPVFNPTLLSNCTLWLDALDRNALVLSGSSVTTWRDKSGGGFNGSVIGTVTNTGNINGRTALNWATADSSFIGNSSNSGTTVTVFSVFNIANSATNFARVVSLGLNGQYDFDVVPYCVPILRMSGGTAVSSYRAGAQLSTVANGLNQNILVCALFDGTNNTLFTNGTSNTSVGSSGSFGYTNYGIGFNLAGGADPQGYFAGRIGEVLIYNTAMTREQRQLVEGYLAWKWGLVGSLPSTHPYKKTPV